MGRIVRAPIDAISVTNDSDQDIWQLVAGANNKIILHEFQVTSASEVAEILDIELIRRSTTGTGTAVTEVANDEDDGSITAVATVLITTPGTPGDILESYQWEQLGPLGHLWTPETRPVIQESGRIALHLSTALGGTTVMSGFLIWEEV